MAPRSIAEQSRASHAEAKFTYKAAAGRPAHRFLSLNTSPAVNNYDTRRRASRRPPAGTAPAVKFSPSSDFYAGAGATYKFGTQ